VGSHNHYLCPKCGYEEDVSGGKDYGMASVVHTMTCNTCHILVDVAIQDTKGASPFDTPDWSDEIGKCPDCGRENVTPWSHPGPCPKCGTTMVDRGMVLLWD